MTRRVPLVLRRARSDDAALLLRWRNDPGTRRGFLNPSPVRHGEHQSWFGRTLAARDSRIYIAEEQGRPVGQLRLDRRGRDTAEISFSIERTSRGRGLGAVLLKRAATAGRRDLAVSRLVAHVLPDNVASAIAFLKAGYRFTGLRRREGRTIYAFELSITR
jgi:RimJ/RimL family protein N-acetyltransferase